MYYTDYIYSTIINDTVIATKRYVCDTYYKPDK